MRVVVAVALLLLAGCVSLPGEPPSSPAKALAPEVDLERFREGTVHIAIPFEWHWMRPIPEEMRSASPVVYLANPGPPTPPLAIRVEAEQGGGTWTLPVPGGGQPCGAGLLLLPLGAESRSYVLRGLRTDGPEEPVGWWGHNGHHPYGSPFEAAGATRAAVHVPSVHGPGTFIVGPILPAPGEGSIPLPPEGALAFMAETEPEPAFRLGGEAPTVLLGNGVAACQRDRGLRELEPPLIEEPLGHIAGETSYQALVSLAYPKQIAVMPDTSFAGPPCPGILCAMYAMDGPSLRIPESATVVAWQATRGDATGYASGWNKEMVLLPPSVQGTEVARLATNTSVNLAFPTGLEGVAEARIEAQLPEEGRDFSLGPAVGTLTVKVLKQGMGGDATLEVTTGGGKASWRLASAATQTVSFALDWPGQAYVRLQGSDAAVELTWHVVAQVMPTQTLDDRIRALFP